MVLRRLILRLTKFLNKIQKCNPSKLFFLKITFFFFYNYFCVLKFYSTFATAQGEMAEWSIATVLKTVDRVSGPGVRIPLSPQEIRA